VQFEAEAAAGDARRGGQAEQLLQAHGKHRRVFRVVDGDARAGRHAQRARRQLIQPLWQRPGQQGLQDRWQVEACEVTEAIDLAQEWRQPLLEAGQQRGIGQVRPFALPLLLQVQLAQQRHACLPLAQLGRPGQQLQPLAPHQADQRTTARLLVQRSQRLAFQHQLADLALAFGAQHAFALIPVEHVQRLDLLGQLAFEQRRVEVGSEIDALLALALATAQVGHHQPFVLHQRIGFAELRSTPIGQPVVGATGAALLGDAIRVGESQQAAEPARVFSVAHRLAHRPALEQAVELPRQLPGTLYATLRRTPSAALAAQQGQTAVQISTSATQYVALGQQRRQVASQGAQPQRLTTQQQMGDARVARQLGHGLAVGIERTTFIEGAQTTE